MPTLEGYRKGRQDQARMIALAAVDTLFTPKDLLTINILRANLLAQCKFGRTGEALTGKDDFSRKQRECILQATAVILCFKDTFFERHTWAWNEEESVAFIKFLKESEFEMRKQVMVLVDEEKVKKAQEILKQTVIPSRMEEISMPLARLTMKPEQVLLSWLRCTIFLWIDSQKKAQPVK